MSEKITKYETGQHPEHSLFPMRSIVSAIIEMEPTEYKFAISIPKSLALKAFHYWFRHYIFTWKMGIALLIIIIFTVFNAMNGLFTLTFYVGSGIISFVILYIFFAYIRQKRILNTMLQRLNDGKIEYKLSEMFISVTAPYASWKLKWDFFNGLIITDDFILILYQQGGYSTLPLQDTPSEVISFLISKITSQKGRIHDARSSV